MGFMRFPDDILFICDCVSRLGSGVEFEGAFLKRGAGDLSCAGSVEVPEETGRGGFGREAAVADVR